MTTATRDPLAMFRLELVAPHGATFSRAPERALHAALYRALERVEPTLAREIHGAAENPFTLSPIYRASDGAPVGAVIERRERVCARITSLDPRVGAALVAALGDDGNPAALDLEHQPFAVAGFGPSPPSGTATVTSASYARVWAAARPLDEITLRFTSPTVFRNKGCDLLVPSPRLVFGSHLRRWRAFSPLTLPPIADDALERLIGLGDTRLVVERRDLGYVTQPGFAGVARYRIGGDALFRRAIDALVAFAAYCGTGARTAFGMGQTERVGP